MWNSAIAQNYNYYSIKGTGNATMKDSWYIECLSITNCWNYNTKRTRCFAYRSPVPSFVFVQGFFFILSKFMQHHMHHFVALFLQQLILVEDSLCLANGVTQLTLTKNMSLLFYVRFLPLGVYLSSLFYNNLSIYASYLFAQLLVITHLSPFLLFFCSLSLLWAQPISPGSWLDVV